MKKIFLLFATGVILLGSGCRRDPFPLEFTRFDVFWVDYDDSGTANILDEFDLLVRVQTTDPDPDDQFITEWELTYFVNGNFGGILQGDEGLRSNEIGLDANIILEFLNFPGPGQFKPGDRLVFRFWAIDNFGTQAEREYAFTLEP